MTSEKKGVLHGLVGLSEDVSSKGLGSIGAVILENGKTVWDSGPITGLQNTSFRTFTVDLEGRSIVEMRITDGKDGIDYDHAAWARVEFVPSAD